MIFTGSLKNNYTFSFMGDFFLLIWICIVLFTILGDKQSCVLQTDKDDLVSYFVKAVNTLFLKNGFQILMNNGFFSVAFKLLTEFIDTA